MPQDLPKLPDALPATALSLNLLWGYAPAVAQIIASSTGLYYLDESVNKRTWALIWGALLTFGFSFVPTFRHFRLLSIIGICGTAYTACFIIGSAAIHGNTVSSSSILSSIKFRVHDMPHPTLFQDSSKSGIGWNTQSIHIVCKILLQLGGCGA